MGERPSELEFSDATKIDALKRAGYRCERCKVPKKKARDGYLEIHHKLAIYCVVNYYPYLFPELVRSIVNAEVLCKDCHQEADNAMQYTHEETARFLGGLTIAMLSNIEREVIR
ncbi:hypothetical protein KBD69_02600 [Candidatus Woesebacteria bacterium]|nr:hypothetical protein [Candidatus Woesebacteria bacterium]